eukprot:scaffold132987_cov30-Tisochrysis_lutea.AAC.2
MLIAARASATLCSTEHCASTWLSMLCCSISRRAVVLSKIASPFMARLSAGWAERPPAATLEAGDRGKRDSKRKEPRRQLQSASSPLPVLEDTTLLVEE